MLASGSGALGRAKWVLGLVGLAVAFLGAVSFAPLASADPSHLTPGHDGRIPGQPDFERIGKTTVRYLSETGQYEVRRPGEPTMKIHADRGAPMVKGKRSSPKTKSPSGALAKLEGGVIPFGPGVELPSQEWGPICRNNGNRIVVVYAGSGTPPTSTLRSIVNRMNWKIVDQSNQSSNGSRVLSMAVQCDQSGQVAVHHVPNLSFPHDPFEDIRFKYVEEAAKEGKIPPAGEGVQAVRYLVFDSPHGELYGVASLYDDISKSRLNDNATEPGYAIVYNGLDSWYRHTTIHELMHSFGAAQGNHEKVNPTAPFSTSDYHCSDGSDALCYQAAGDAYCPASQGYGTPTGIPIDCNYNTYFDAAPTGGTWLASYWNTAQVENPFLTPAPTQPAAAATSSASDVKAFSATLKGTVTPNAEYAFYRFEWGLTTSYGNNVPAQLEPVQFSDGAAGYGSSPITVSQPLSGLQGGTTYHYRVVAKNDNGQLAYSADKTFKTLGPKVITGEATTAVPHKATLHATINPNGVKTQCRFHWRVEGQSLTKTLKDQDMGSGTQDVACEGQLDGLQPYITYGYQAEAASSNGTSAKGAEKTFTTPGWGYAKGTVKAPTGITARGVTLSGEVDPKGTLTTYRFEYDKEEGEDLPFETGVVSTPAKDAGSGSEAIAISEPVGKLGSGGPYLEPASTYHARLAVTNPTGTAYSDHVTFETPAWTPAAGTGAATEVLGRAATLHGTIDTDGNIAVFNFEYGTTASYGQESESKGIGFGGGYPLSEDPTEGSIVLTGLQPSTTYHYRIKAGVLDGESTDYVYGEDRTFTTGPSPWVATEGASEVRSTSAKLRASVGPEGLPTTYQLEYGPTTAYGTKVPASPKSVGSGTSAVAVSEALEGLDPRTTYHYRVVATNADGTTYGEDMTFTTWADWSLQSTPNPKPPATNANLQSVSCASASMCMAVGENKQQGHTYLQLWDGTDWETPPSYEESVPAAGTYHGVSCPTTTSCLAVGTNGEGKALAQRWVYLFGAWNTSASAPANPAGATEVKLTDVSCTATNACTAVGHYKHEGKTKTLAERWNGSAWSIQATPNPEAGNAELRGVSCESATSCTAVGTQGSSAYAMRWNGTSWSASSVPTPEGTTASALLDVSCTAASFCMAVGAYTSTGYKTLALRWNGSSWSVALTPNPAGAILGHPLTDVSCNSASACTAVGSYYTEGGRKTMAMSWGGTEWAMQSTPDPETPNVALNGVSCASASQCAAVGSDSGSEGGAVTLGLRYE